MCGKLLPKLLQQQGYIISPKSKLTPVQETVWLGKEIDLVQLRIGNSQQLHTRVFIAVINVHGRVVHTKTIVRYLVSLVGLRHLRKATSRFWLEFGQ